MNQYVRILAAAITATVIMTGFMLVAPFIGLPRMNVGVILGSIFNCEVVGWIIHCLMGLAFTLPYVFFFNHWLPVENKIARGTIYGILIFVFSEIILMGANMTGNLNSIDKQNLSLMVFGNALACMLYGTVLGAFFTRIESDGMEQVKNHGQIK